MSVNDFILCGPVSECQMSVVDVILYTPVSNVSVLIMLNSRDLCVYHVLVDTSVRCVCVDDVIL